MRNNSPINDVQANPTVPQQKLSSSQKGKKWQKANISGGNLIGTSP